MMLRKALTNAVLLLLLLATVAIGDEDKQFMCGTDGLAHPLRWGQKHHDSFKVACDLVFLVNQEKDIHVHMRTQNEERYSYIAEIAIAIGKHHAIVYMENYVNIFQGNHVLRLPLDEDVDNQTFPPMKLHAIPGSSYNNITIGVVGEKVYQIRWGTEAFMNVMVYQELINIRIHGDAEDFANSLGMAGQFGRGDLLDRQGRNDTLANFAAAIDEWQVKPELGDPVLLSPSNGPQWPRSKCKPLQQQQEQRPTTTSTGGFGVKTAFL